MNVPYIRPHHKMVGSLVGETTTIDNHICDWIMDLNIDSLQGNALDVVYSTPTGKKDLRLEDICTIHLIDPSGIVVAEKTDVAYSDSWDFIEQIDAMVEAMPEKGYVVCIESVRDGVKLRNDVEINATHSYLAISGALNGIMSTVYDDIFDKETNTLVKSLASNKMPIEVTLYNGNRYKLLAVAETDNFDDGFACHTH